MTLKQKVAEMEPEQIDNLLDGGVHGCPHNYDYLGIAIREDAKQCGCETTFYGEQQACAECWNSEYKEVFHAK